MTRKDYDLAIVGGGIVGASAGYFASKTDWTVVLFDDPDSVGPATPAAAGILQPPHFLDREKPLAESSRYAELQERSYRFYPEFLEQLGEDNEGAPEWNPCGGIRLAVDESEVTELQTYGQEMNRHGQPAEWFSGNTLREKFPWLSDSLRGGLELPRETRLDPVKLLELLHSAVNQAPSVELIPRRVKSIDDGPDPVKLATAEGKVTADRVLVTAGAWSGDLVDLSKLGEIRIEPRAGEMIRLDWAGVSFDLNLHGSEYHGYLRNGGLELGATVLEDGFASEVAEQSRKILLKAGRDWFERRLQAEQIVDAWRGHRPWINRKGGPFLGPVNDNQSVWLAAGHYRTGILQGPYTARLVVDSLAGVSEEAGLRLLNAVN